MEVNLSYGRTGLLLETSDEAVVLAARRAPILPDEAAAIRNGLRQPIGTVALRDKVRPGESAVVVHIDITRATPNEHLLPIVLSELEAVGIRRSDITLLNALGTHRPQTSTELPGMLGDFIVDNFHCLQHDAWDDGNLVSLGKTCLGHPVRINRFYAEAQIRILTGFIERHFFAGYSGGPKGVLPSIAGFESVLSNHGREMIAHPKAIFGVTCGNPIWEEMREVALRTAPTF